LVTAEARTIVGSHLGLAVPWRDVPTYVEMYRDGRLPVQELISSTIGLAEVNEALDALAQGEALRQVIVFK
jgi:alcohol dehydrogenase